MADGNWKGVYPQFGAKEVQRSHSFRKGCAGEEEKWESGRRKEWWKWRSTDVAASQLPERQQTATLTLVPKIKCCEICLCENMSLY